MTLPHALYPIFLQLHGKKVLVVGGGTVAERKVRALLPSGAHVHVGAPELTSALREWADAGTIRWHTGRFEPDWLDGTWLIIAATDERRVNAQIRDLATAQRIWVNVVDDPELSAFQVPAVVDRAPITVAISSGGYAPVLARRLRERLETSVDHNVGRLAALLAQRRTAIREAYPDLAQRRRFYDWTLDGPVLALISEGSVEAAAAMLEQALESPQNWPRSLLTVLAAPADDPGLLTLKGLRALHEADALLFDPRHHDETVLAMARRDAERLPIELENWMNHGESADEIQQMLRSHGRVVLLTDTHASPMAQALSAWLAKLKTLSLPIARL